MNVGSTYRLFGSLADSHQVSGQDDGQDGKPLPGFKFGIVLLTLTYIALTIGLILAFGRVKKLQYLEEINRGTRSKITGDRIILWHFIFLQTCLGCRMLEAAIILYHELGYSDTKKMHDWVLRIVYFHSMIFLMVAYSLIIFQYRFISMRVYLYASLSDVETFREQFKQARLVFWLSLMILILIHLVIIFFDVFYPVQGMREINTMVLFLESLALLTGFVVMGTILATHLKRYYEKRYSVQRTCLIKQIFAVSLAMIVQQLKLMIEFLYCYNDFCDKYYSGHFPDVQADVVAGVAIVLIADIAPIAVLIYCLWIAASCQFDYLISGYLKVPQEDERTTVAGSHMLDELRAELVDQSELISGFKETTDGEPKSDPNQFPNILLEGSFDYREDSNLSYLFLGKRTSERKKTHRPGMLYESMAQPTLEANPFNTPQKLSPVGGLNKPKLTSRQSEVVPDLYKLNSASKVSIKNDESLLQQTQLVSKDTPLFLSRDFNMSNISDISFDKSKQTMILAFDPSQDLQQPKPKFGETNQNNSLQSEPFKDLI